MDESLHGEYLLERFGASERRPEIDFDEMGRIASQAPTPDDPLAGLLRVSDLPDDHASVRLVRSRRLPDLSTLYHSDDFLGWANRLSPGKYGADPPREPRLVIPFHREGRLIGFQGRSYDGSSRSKYLTVCLDKTVPFLYGWDGVDTSQEVVAVEGPIDSMFLDNSVATAGGSITRELEGTGVPRDRFVVAYDNEPRSPQTIKKMYKAVEMGYKVLVWPERVLEKDFNDLVLAGWTRSSVMTMVRERTFGDLDAVLELNSWKRAEV